jgi:hypothetical protein
MFRLHSDAVLGHRKNAFYFSLLSVYFFELVTSLITAYMWGAHKIFINYISVKKKLFLLGSFITPLKHFRETFMCHQFEWKLSRLWWLHGKKVFFDSPHVCYHLGDILLWFLRRRVRQKENTSVKFVFIDKLASVVLQTY